MTLNMREEEVCLRLSLLVMYREYMVLTDKLNQVKLQLCAQVESLMQLAKIYYDI